MRRRLVGELMDDPGVPREQLDSALHYIRKINAKMGGVEALLGHLRAWSARWDRTVPVTILDVGTGSADLPLAVYRWANEAGFLVQITGVDIHETTLDLAREQVGKVAGAAGAITLLREDALKLEERFAARSFEYVHAGLFLHHLTDEQVLEVLRSMDRLAWRGMVWNDLVRSRVGHAVITLMTLGKPRIIAHDARASVAAGFTREEVEGFARRAGIGYARYGWNIFSHRFTLAGEKAGG